MTVLALLSVPCELIERVPSETLNEYGDPGWDETLSETTCEIQESASAEALGDAVETATFRVFLPPDAPLRGWDALRVSESLYELDGDAWEARNPRTGSVSHVEAIVRRVE